jgi:hypothetical protein
MTHKPGVNRSIDPAPRASARRTLTILWTTCCACIVVSSCANGSRGASHQGSPAATSSSDVGGQSVEGNDAVIVGTQCVPYGKSAPEGPRSFLVRDLGKPGVPALDSDQLKTIHQIQQYVHAKTLRFAFVGRASQDFIVFNAKLGPCLDAAGGYVLLNGECGDFYEPGEDPWYRHALPGGTCGPSRPWIRDDPGDKVDPSYWLDP